MSDTANQIVSIWEDFECYIRSRTLSRKGLPLSSEQKTIYSDALVLTTLAWYDYLSKLDEPTTRWILPWLHCVTTTDLDLVVGCLKEADRLLLSSVEDDSYSCDRFKHDLRHSFRSISGDLLGPLSRAVAGWFTNREPAAFGVLHGCLCFIQRLNLPNLKDLEEEARAAYIKSEEDLQLDGFTSEEEQIISDWFPAIDAQRLYDDWHPKHGPGAVADAQPYLMDKYLALGTDPRINFLNLRLGEKASYPLPAHSFERISKVVFVPKSIDKLRTICAEPATLQWYQQGFFRSISMYIKRHRYLSRRVDLENQELSRDLARKGSIYGYYSTIDLSSASDSVSWPLVRQWTKTSALREICLCTRSYMSRLPDGSLLKNNKFAPMGSALCFPMECLVFCAIVEAAILDVGGHPHGSVYRVYGDDIIVETSYADAVIKRLQHNGFTVNTKKSFCAVSTHNFRESCGGEYIDGLDVTPVRLSRRFSGYQALSRNTPSRITGLIDLCNDCNAILPTVRRRVIVALNKLPRSLRPLFGYHEDKGIKSPNPSNFHLEPPAWNTHLQRWEVYHGSLVKMPNKAERVVGQEHVELIRYYEQLRATVHRTQCVSPDDYVSAWVLPPGREKWSKTRSQLPTA